MVQDIVGGVMPNHKPHTYSHEDVLFVKETYKNIKQSVSASYMTYEAHCNLIKDIDRCIQILEKDNE